MMAWLDFDPLFWGAGIGSLVCAFGICLAFRGAPQDRERWAWFATAGFVAALGASLEMGRVVLWEHLSPVAPFGTLLQARGETFIPGAPPALGATGADDVCLVVSLALAAVVGPWVGAAHVRARPGRRTLAACCLFLSGASAGAAVLTHATPIEGRDQDVDSMAALMLDAPMCRELSDAPTLSFDSEDGLWKVWDHRANGVVWVVHSPLDLRFAMPSSGYCGANDVICSAERERVPYYVDVPLDLPIETLRPWMNAAWALGYKQPLAVVEFVRMDDPVSGRRGWCSLSRPVRPWSYETWGDVVGSPRGSTNHPLPLR